jgi:hypothetical protein
MVPARSGDFMRAQFLSLAVSSVAPSDDVVVEYDRRHLLTYAELIDAADADIDWLAGSLDILGIDPIAEPERARCCWDSHLARARWIVGDGLVTAVNAFRSLPRNGTRAALK